MIAHLLKDKTLPVRMRAYSLFTTFNQFITWEAKLSNGIYIGVGSNGSVHTSDACDSWTDNMMPICWEIL